MNKCNSVGNLVELGNLMRHGSLVQLSFGGGHEVYLSQNSLNKSKDDTQV